MNPEIKRFYVCHDVNGMRYTHIEYVNGRIFESGYDKDGNFDWFELPRLPDLSVNNYAKLQIVNH